MKILSSILVILTLNTYLWANDLNVGELSKNENMTNSKNKHFNFDSMPALPNIGLATPFVGMSHDVLITAGGANFPDGEAKVWRDDIYVLEKGKWKLSSSKLPEKIAYGVSVTYKDSVICVGGGNATQHFSDVFKITYIEGAIVIETLPSLKQATAFMSGAIINSTIYIAGGIAAPDSYTSLDTFQSLDLNKISDGWKILPPCINGGRMKSGCSVLDGKFYVYSGVKKILNEDMRYVNLWLKDNLCFDPAANSWQQLADLPHPAESAPTPAMITSDNCFVVFGGNDSNSAIYDNGSQGKGFCRNILEYNQEIDKWQILNSIPNGIAATVTTNALQIGSKYIVVSGEIRPKVRSPQVYCVEKAKE